MNKLSKTQFVLYLVAIFVAGGVTGAAIALKTSKQMMAEAPAPSRIDARYLKQRYESKLNLTPEQSQVVEPILEKMSDDLKSIRQDTSKRISGMMKTSYDQMGKCLSSEQRAKLEEMRKDHREDRHEPQRKRKPWFESVRKTNAPPQTY